MHYQPGKFGSYGSEFETSSRYTVKRRTDLRGLIPTDLKPTSILELGCADGENLKYFAETFSISESNSIGVDICRSKEKQSTGFRFHHMSIESYLSLCERQFDIVLLSDVLEHTYNPWRTLSDLKPFLSHDGILVISVPNIQNIHYLHAALSGNFFYQSSGLFDETHIRFFSRNTLCEYLGQAGYHVLRTDWRPDVALASLRDQVEQSLQASLSCTLNLGSASLSVNRENLDEYFGQQILIAATHAS